MVKVIIIIVENGNDFLTKRNWQILQNMLQSIFSVPFFSLSSREFIECVRIIRDSTPNQYMVLVKFRNQVLANLSD